MNKIVIINCKRTPLGAFNGQLRDQTAQMLGASAIKGCLEGFNNIHVDNVIMGCVLSAGLGQNPARQASILAGLPVSVNAMTVNKVCGSGMQSAMLACDLLSSGSSKIALAGGMESMTNAPYLLSKARAGYRLGHGKTIDHMFCDGLEDAYSNGKLMGQFAEDTATLYNFSREEQDQYAINSVQKARNNLDFLKQECTPINTKANISVISDEPPNNINIDKIPKLKPAFSTYGTVTAASSSSIADGAGCLLLMTETTAIEYGYTPLAKIVSFANFAQEPSMFTTAPIGAIKLALQHANWTLDDIDLFEINEAFAVVPMATIRDLQLPPEKVNVFGGACALGHPLGASGTRIIVTLINALRQKNLRRGLASLCVGGGEGIAMTVELVN